jgi:hypothetical protein
MSSPIPVVKPAIYTLLRNSTGLIAVSHDSDNKALVYPLNGVPNSLMPPYTVLSRLESIGNPLKTSSFGETGPKWAMELLLTLDTWSLYDGGLIIDQMHDAIREALNGKESNITALITGHTCTYCLFDTNNVLEDNSTSIKLLHGVERYMLRTEEI